MKSRRWKRKSKIVASSWILRSGAGSESPGPKRESTRRAPRTADSFFSEKARSCCLSELFIGLFHPAFVLSNLRLAICFGHVPISVLRTSPHISAHWSMSHRVYDVNRENSLMLYVIWGAAACWWRLGSWAIGKVQSGSTKSSRISI